MWGGRKGESEYRPVRIDSVWSGMRTERLVDIESPTDLAIGGEADEVGVDGGDTTGLPVLADALCARGVHVRVGALEGVHVHAVPPRDVHDHRLQEERRQQAVEQQPPRQQKMRHGGRG